MTHVITGACCSDAACVAICPVNCIHPAPGEPGYGSSEMLYIDPAVCVDCGACVAVCPVDAIIADVDLDDEHAPFTAMNATWYDAPGRRDYEQVQVRSKGRTRVATDRTAVRIAIIGSGPSACYTADALLAVKNLDVAVDVFERLPVPGGLVRYGVAPDHQPTKAVSGVFTRILRRNGVRLFLDTEIGRDIGLDEIRARYDAVVIAAGASQDRPVGYPGEDLPGSYSAADFVAWYNGHPDFVGKEFDLSSERAVIVGNGNVAFDVARILTAGHDYLARTDIADHALAALRESRVREVVVVARRGPAEAAFTAKELLGLARTPGVAVVVDPSDLSGAPADADLSSTSRRKMEMLRELAAAQPGTAERTVRLMFGVQPVEARGSDRVRGLRLRPRGDDGEVDTEIAAGAVFRAAGHRGQPIVGAPFDDTRGTIPHDRGRVVDPGTGSFVDGLYVVGWLKRGPSGVIGTNKADARETVDALLDDIEAGRLPGPTCDDDVATLLPDAIDRAGWQAIDDFERAQGRALRRPRVKVVERAELRRIALQG